MNLIIIAVIAVAIAAIAIVVDRRIQTRKALAKTVEDTGSEKSTDESTDTEKNTWGQSLRSNWVSLRSRLGGEKKKMGESFQQWAGDNITDKELRTWLTGLSPEAIQALTVQLTEFCVDLGFELNWLIEGKLQSDPEIEKEARNVVASYCTACWRAAQGYNDFEFFKIMQGVQENPFNREYRALSQKLFSELVKREMAPSVPAELIIASEKERQEHMAQAIYQAVEANRDTFKQTLRDVLAAENESVEAAAATNGHVAQGEPTVESEVDQKPKKRGFFNRGKKAESEDTTASSSGEADTSASGPSAPEPAAS